ncbi:MAG: hypothetical protein AMXMBFR78_11610 [Rubrivivax sp.]
MSHRPLLIGLIGRAGAGKDTVAGYLEDEHAFERIGFADPIRDMVLALFNRAGIPEAWASERALKEQPTGLGVSYRRIAQTLGTEWGRSCIAPDLWIRIAALQLDQCVLQQHAVVISDVRFANEAAWIRQRGGVLVRVLRDGPPAAADHISEHELANLQVDHELLNHGGLETLFDQVERLIEPLRR